MSQDSLPGMSVFGVGDVLDRCYTPDVLAADVVDTLDLHGDPTVVEPSAGGGAFVRALRARLAGRGSVIAVDVDPGAIRFPYVHHVAGSWPSVAADWRRTGQWVDIIVGNPPFSGDVAIEHVEAALALRPSVVSMILPWSYWGVARWTSLLWSERRPAVVRPILGRPWPDKVREVAVYEWHPRERVEVTRTVPLQGRWT